MGVVTFFIVALVKFLINIVSDNNDNAVRIIDCVNCFINDECGQNVRKDGEAVDVPTGDDSSSNASNTGDSSL